MSQSSLFWTTPLPGNGGYAYTITSYLSTMLMEIESLYGPRDMSWTIVGVEFHAGVPQIWFPHNLKYVAIQLGQNALNDMPLACWQLAHEAIHLLCPVGTQAAPVMEEGLASFYSDKFLFSHFKIPSYGTDVKYKAAASLINQLITQEGDDVIKRLRAAEPSFKKMTPQTFKDANVLLDANVIDQLLMPFYK